MGLFRCAKYNECKFPGAQSTLGEQNIGKYCACKGALRKGAPRQEFGFKLLFVPDKSALNAGGCLNYPSTYTKLYRLPNKNQTQDFRALKTTQLFCARTVHMPFCIKTKKMLKCIWKVSIIEEMCP